MNYEAVIFDMDGIIFDSEKAVMDCWIAVAEKYHIPNIEEPYRACIGTNAVKTRDIMMNAYGPAFPYDTYSQEASLLFHQKYDHGRLPLKPGVHEILTFLKAGGIKIALASSTRKERVVTQLKEAGLIGFFDAIIGGDMVSKSKPDPEIFLAACMELAVAPKKAFAIEDSYNGIRSATSGQLRAIMVPDLLPETEEMATLAEVICKDLFAAQAYLNNLI